MYKAEHCFDHVDKRLTLNKSDSAYIYYIKLAVSYPGIINS